MNPSNLWWHAAAAYCTALTFVVLGGPAEQWVATILLCMTVATVAGLNSDYGRRLAGHSRSATRKDKDAKAFRSTLPALTVALAICIVLTFTTDGVAADRDWTQGAFWWLTVVLTALAGQILIVSSCIDWYYVKPRRDGIIWEPPCRRTDREKWRIVTRVWILHRLVAAGIAVLVVLSGSAILLTIADRYATSDVLKAILTVTGPLALVSLLLYNYTSSWKPALQHGALNDTTVVIGDRVDYRGDTGIAYDVSIPKGYRIIDSSGRSWFLKFQHTDTSNALKVVQSDPGAEWVTAVLSSGVLDVHEFNEPGTVENRKILVT